MYIYNMNDEIYDKYCYIAKYMMGYGYIKQIWKNKDKLKVLFELYSNELFIDVDCSLKIEDKECIVRRLKRISNKIHVLYIQYEGTGFPNGWLNQLESRILAFSNNDYNRSSCNTLP